MRSASEIVVQGIEQGGAVQLEVRAFLGGSDLGTLPVRPTGWSVGDSDDEQVPGSLTFEVPNTADMWPTRPRHPLAARGHRFRVRLGYRVPGEPTLVEWLQLGWFIAAPPTESDDVLRVTGRGLLHQVDVSRFLTPLRTGTSTRMRVVDQLLAGILPVRYVGLVNESQAAAVWEEDRLDALRKVADAWPARVRVSDDGVVELRPPYNDSAPGNPVVTIARGANLVSCSISTDQDGLYNAYRVSTIPEGDEAPVTETWTQPDGDYAWGGPWGYRPAYYASPVLSPNRVQLRAIAQTMTLRALRRTDALDITMVSDPRLQPGDVVRVVDGDLDGICRVVDVTHGPTTTTLKAAWLRGTR